ncbi:MAG: cyclic nucleotide-binding domain-containing protein [Proteobacteria bacterium]|nr:cyclic nucleotide-binding domain-containing protein [Pseudomonadota bacterium]
MSKIEKTFQSGDIIFNEGEPGGDIYIIKSGEVKVYQLRGGSEILLAQLGQGELLGAMTATTGTPRTASVKALTKVTVTIVAAKDMEKLLKDMPPWARILIKDLIFRLNFMNEIYIQSVSADSTIRESHSLLRSATRLAKGILANARVHEREIDGHLVIDLHSSFSPLLDIFLTDKSNFLRIYSLFMQERLLECMELRQPGKFLSKSELLGLQIFYDLANTQMGLTKLKKTLPALALGERKTLSELASWAKTQVLDKQNQLVMNLSDCEDRLAKTINRKHTIHVLQRASAWGMLHLDKSTTKVTIRPDFIRQTIASIAIIHALKQDEVQRPKDLNPSKAG